MVRVTVALAIAMAFVTTCSLFSFGQARNMITEKIVESNTVPLQGSIHPLAQAQYDKGSLGDDEPLGHVFLLLSRSPEQQQNLDAMVDQLHNPKSPLFHKWLSAEEYGKTFGISDSDLHTVESWLQSKGLQIEETPAGRTAIIFTGTVGQLRRAFNVDIHQFSVNGQTYQANVNIPTIPAALAPAVIGFKQLHNFPHSPNMVGNSIVKRDGKTGQWSKVSGPASAPEITYNYSGYYSYDVTPQDFYTIYNENSALTSGVTGAGVTIAVIEETGIHNNTTNGTGDPDVTSFRSAFGLPAYPTTGANSTQGGINYYNGNVPGSTACTAASTPTSTGEEGEALLDVEWAGAVAPNAIVDFVACKTGSGVGSYGTDISATAIANYLYSTVSSTSLSYGVCETSAGTTGKTFYTNLWEQMAAEGITAVVSSGDAGSAGCNQNASYESSNISSNAMSSTAYNISAGGTDFSDVYQVAGAAPSTYWNTTGNNGSYFESALSYIPEVTWGGYCSNPLFASYLQALAATSFGTTYTTQAICNNSNASSYRAVVGGEGGISVYNTIPSWQSVYGIGSGKTSTTYRNQPDISFFASSGWWGHAVVYCQSDATVSGVGGPFPCTYSNTQDAYYNAAGGTSFVAPQINGLMALINQKTGARQGQANYTLYNLAAQEYGTVGSPNASIANCSGSALGPNVSSSCVFHDIANDTPCLSGGTTMCGTANGALSSSTIASDIVQACRSTVSTCYVTGSNKYGLSSTSNAAGNLAYQSAQGYDLGTGLGSVNITNLVNNWNTVSSAFTSTTAISASSSSITNTGSTNLTGKVTATQRGGVPSGTVSFYIGSTGGTNLGSAPLVANACTGTAPNIVCTASATLSVAGSALACGSNSVIAYFPGDAANDAASTSSSTNISVTCQQATTTAVSSSANPSTYGQSVSFTATVTGNSPTGTVQFVIDSANFGSPVTLSGGSATSGSTSTLSAGSHTVSASYSGDSANLGSSGTLAGGQTVSQASQAITFTTPAPASAEYGSQFTVAATGGASGNAIVYTSAGACSNSGATYTMTASSGNCSVIANQAGNANYAAAPTVTETTSATDANGGVSVATSGPTTYGQSATFTATITSDT
ncbi:MAG: protease pro-enzyme activation domain-containing protein, partial [Terriglobales bacterium]